MTGGFPPRSHSTIATRPLDAAELAGALDVIGRDYAAALRLTADLAPSDRRRRLSKTRSRYRRRLAETLRTAGWLTVAEEPR